MASRIKKLTKLSLDIIKTYGLSYYLRVAIDELEKQKLDLLRDQVGNNKLEQIKAHSDSEKYKIYVEKYNSESTNNILESQLNYKPKFTIIIPSNPKNLTYIEPLFVSIKKQVYDNYEIIILQSDDNLKNSITEKLDLTNNKAITNITFISKTSDIQKNVHGDFVCVLEPGNKLTNNAFFKTCEFLNKNTDSEIIYTDSDNLDKNGNRINPFFKPDWSPYLFFSINYLGPLCFIRKEIFNKLPLDKISNSTLHYETILKATEISKKIKHVSLPLCSVQQKPFSNQFLEKKKILSNYFEQKKINATVDSSVEAAGVFNIKFNFENNPLVSIIIPTKNNRKILNRCIQSIQKYTSYKNFEIIIIDNNSTDPSTKSYYQSLPYTVLDYKDSFNFSKMNNYAVKHAKGDFLLFLNDDTKVLEPDWLQEMIGVCSQNDVGAVGAKLVYSDNTIQHAGIVILETGAGFHPFQQLLQDSDRYFNFINVMRDCSAVTGACLMTKKEIFTKVNGFDDDFDLYYGDADLCLRIIDSGYHVVYAPSAKLLHEGSHSIKTSLSSLAPHPVAHFAVENHFQFIKKWPLVKNGDQFYNKNLSWDYSIKSIE